MAVNALQTPHQDQNHQQNAFANRDLLAWYAKWMCAKSPLMLALATSQISATIMTANKNNV
jgi:hypothetical protein